MIRVLTFVIVRSFTTFGIVEATKIAKMAKKAWRSQRVKARPAPSYNFNRRERYGEYHPEVPPPGVAPAVGTAPPALSAFVRQVCDVCGRTGHSEPTCYQAHPELRPIRP